LDHHGVTAMLLLDRAMQRRLVVTGFAIDDGARPAFRQGQADPAEAL